MTNVPGVKKVLGKYSPANVEDKVELQIVKTMRTLISLGLMREGKAKKQSA